MKENKNKDKVNDLPFDEGLEIFGEHKTREQVRAEEKIRRKEERAALKQELKRRQTSGKEGTPAYRKDVIIVSIVLVGIVLLCLLALFNAFHEDKDTVANSINEARGHFVDANASPEMSGEEPKAAVSEAYFTNDGHLYVKLLISNGTDRMVRIDSLEVKAFEDALYEQQFAGGKAMLTEENVTIEVAGEIVQELYISPEHVMAADNYQLPESVYFEISIEYHNVEVE